MKNVCNSGVKSLFKDMVFDKDSGELLHPQYSAKHGGQVYRFFRKQKKQMKFRTRTVSPSELNNMVIDRIREEKMEAQRVVEFLNSPEGSETVKETLKSFRETAKTKFEELVEVVSKLPVTESDPSEEDMILLRKADEIESELEALAAEYEPEKKLFSIDNPWVNLYVFFEMKEFPSRETAKRFVQKIMFDQYGECEIELNRQEYKEPLINLMNR